MPTIDDDLEAIFTSGDFDTCAEFTLASGGKVCVNGIFTDASDEVLVGGQVAVEAVKPSLMVQTSKVASVRNKDSAEIDGTTYQVERKGKVGQGMTVVYLKT